MRRVTKAIRREMRRRAAVEPVIGHLKDDHRMRRNHLKGRDGDRINAVLAAAGYNFSLLLRWLAELLRAIIRAFAETASAQKDRLNQRSPAFFTEDSPVSVAPCAIDPPSPTRGEGKWHLLTPPG